MFAPYGYRSCCSFPGTAGASLAAMLIHGRISAVAHGAGAVIAAESDSLHQHGFATRKAVPGPLHHRQPEKHYPDKERAGAHESTSVAEAEEPATVGLTETRRGSKTRSSRPREFVMPHQTALRELPQFSQQQQQQHGAKTVYGGATQDSIG